MSRGRWIKIGGLLAGLAAVTTVVIVGHGSGLAGASGSGQGVPDEAALISGLKCANHTVMAMHPVYAAEEVVGADTAAAAVTDLTSRVFAAVPELGLVEIGGDDESAAFASDEAFVRLAHWDEGWVTESFGYCQEAAQDLGVGQ